MIRLIGLNEVDAIWPSIAEGMAACCKKSGGDITPDWLFMSCRRGDALLYVVEKTGRVLSEGKIVNLGPGNAVGSTAAWVEQKTLAGALIGQPQIWAGQRVLRVTAFCGADMETWLEELLFDKVQLPGLGIGKVIFDGRAGFLPLLQEMVGKDRVRVVRQIYELSLTGNLTDGR